MRWDNRATVLARAAIGGLAIAASVPPWGFWPLAFVGVALLDGLIAGRTRKSRFCCGDRSVHLFPASFKYLTDNAAMFGRMNRERFTGRTLSVLAIDEMTNHLL